MSDNFILRLCFTALFAVMTSAALAQGVFVCPAGSVAVSGGGGTMCLCPDNSYADLSGCQSGPQYQSEPQPLVQPEIPNAQEAQSPLIAAWDNLASLLATGRPFDWSGGSLSQQLPKGPVSPPPNRAAAKALQELVEQKGPQDATTVAKGGQPVDPFTGRAVQLQPTIPSSQSQSNIKGAPGSYASCVGSSTFGAANPAYCQMGGYIYFRNGKILNDN